MKILFATSLDNDYVWKAINFLARLVENKDTIYLRKPIDKGIPEKYDVGISFLYQHKVPKSELNVPWINFHPGPLPEYGGRNVVYHAMMNREDRFGGTIHYMDENFDTGNIIEVETFLIHCYDTAGDVINNTYNSLLNLFYKYIPQILDGKMPFGHKQNNGKYFKKQKIYDEITLARNDELRVRALTVHPKYHAKVKIGNKIYKIVPEESCIVQ